MAHIKCRYTYPMCYENSMGFGKRIHHDWHWSCDSNDGCPRGKYQKPKVRPLSDRGVEIINPRCTYCKYESGEWEKTVKRYEYEDGVLTVCGKTYDEDEIDYLEIDGRVLINKEDD